MSYCSYYQAKIDKKKTLFLVAILKGQENLVMARNLGGNNEIFEFFVSSEFEDRFLDLMEEMKNIKIVKTLMKLPNRLGNQDKC